MQCVKQKYVVFTEIFYLYSATKHYTFTEEQK